MKTSDEVYSSIDDFALDVRSRMAARDFYNKANSVKKVDVHGKIDLHRAQPGNFILSYPKLNAHMQLIVNNGRKEIKIYQGGLTELRWVLMPGSADPDSYRYAGKFIESGYLNKYTGVYRRDNLPDPISNFMIKQRASIRTFNFETFSEGFYDAKID